MLNLGTHITCVACHHKWCYHCERLEKDVGGFSSHNNWNLSCPENSGKCPMYLQYKYGDKDVENRKDGDPAKALGIFHTKLQQKEIEKLRQETDTKLWTKVVESHFSHGIFSINDTLLVAPAELKE